MGIDPGTATTAPNAGTSPTTSRSAWASHTLKTGGAYPRFRSNEESNHNIGILDVRHGPVLRRQRRGDCEPAEPDSLHRLVPAAAAASPGRLDTGIRAGGVADPAEPHDRCRPPLREPVQVVQQSHHPRRPRAAGRAHRSGLAGGQQQLRAAVRAGVGRARQRADGGPVRRGQVLQQRVREHLAQRGEHAAPELGQHPESLVSGSVRRPCRRSRSCQYRAAERQHHERRDRAAGSRLVQRRAVARAAAEPGHPRGRCVQQRQQGQPDRQHQHAGPGDAGAPDRRVGQHPRIHARQARANIARSTCGSTSASPTATSIWCPTRSRRTEDQGAGRRHPGGLLSPGVRLRLRAPGPAPHGRGERGGPAAVGHHAGRGVELPLVAAVQRARGDRSERRMAR